jgi:hypothetical protein
MMKKLMVVLLVLIGMSANAQNTRTQKADLGGIMRMNAVGFAIGSKGYIGLGYNDTTATLLRFKQ